MNEPEQSGSTSTVPAEVIGPFIESAFAYNDADLEAQDKVEAPPEGPFKETAFARGDYPDEQDLQLEQKNKLALEAFSEPGTGPFVGEDGASTTCELTVLLSYVRTG